MSCYKLRNKNAECQSEDFDQDPNMLLMIFPLLSGEFPPTFTHKRRGQYLFAFKGYSVDINCQVNDTLAEVELLQDVSGKGRITRVPDDVKVTQSGQIFTIKDVQSSDKGLCECRIKKKRTWVLRAETLYPLTAWQGM